MPEHSAAREFIALICFEDPATQAAVTEQLTPLGFAINSAHTPEDALTQLRSQNCDLVVVPEEFGGADAFTNPVLSQINEFPQDTRRGMFVVLIGPDRKTFAEMDAFSLSVDLILNPQDIPRLQALVGQGLTHKEVFYRVFRAIGKQIEQDI